MSDPQIESPEDLTDRQVEIVSAGGFIAFLGSLVVLLVALVLEVPLIAIAASVALVLSIAVPISMAEERVRRDNQENKNV